MADPFESETTATTLLMRGSAKPDTPARYSKSSLILLGFCFFVADPRVSPDKGDRISDPLLVFAGRVLAQVSRAIGLREYTELEEMASRQGFQTIAPVLKETDRRSEVVGITHTVNQLRIFPIICRTFNSPDFRRSASWEQHAETCIRA